MNARAIVPTELQTAFWFSSLELMLTTIRHQPCFPDVVKQLVPGELHSEAWFRALFVSPESIVPHDETATDAENILRSLFKPLDPSTKKERRHVTRNDLVKKRSTKPLWELANTHLPFSERFERPPDEMVQLHRRVSTNLSGFTEAQTVVVAHIAMELSTRVAKFADTFGNDQTDGRGGPYYTFAKTRAPPPRDEGVHGETCVKGYTQLAKTVDEVAQAWADFFLEGLFPVVFLRLKGGALVATRDVAQTVQDFNLILRDVYRRLYAAHYRHVPGLEEDGYLAFYLTARCASRGEGVQFVSETSYRLAKPQVLIACTNVPQLKTIFYPGKASSALSLAEIFSGVRAAGQDEDVNPYLPYAWDENVTRVRPAIAAIFDEDDQNRSATGREAKDRMLFQEHAGCNEMLAALRVQEDEENVEDEQQSSLSKFYETLRGLRALFASVTTWSATPTTPIYSIGNRASEAAIHMVELVPGKGYVGYDMPRLRQIAPHCKTFVHVEEMPNRQNVARTTLSQMYGIVLQSVGLPRTPPPPFQIAANGTVRLAKKDENELLHGTMLRACELRDRARKLHQATCRGDDTFWRTDGANVMTLLEDLEARRDEYDYRNALIMTPSTLRTHDKSKWATKILTRDERLTRDLLVIEWSHTGVRFGWVDLDARVFEEALLDFADDAEAAGFVRRCKFERRGARTYVVSTVANVNMAYSVANAYRRRTQRFLKIVVLAGEIGGRGVRYKTHVGHKLVLTDMFYSFEVQRSKALTVTAATALQAVGRVCTMVPDPTSIPKITLWIPRECWTFVAHWMKVMDSLPQIYAAQREHESIERTVDRLLVEDRARFAELARHFATSTGQATRGKRHHACLDHRRQAARQAHMRTQILFQETGATLPRPVDTDYDREERLQEERAILELRRMEGIEEASDDEEEEEEASDEDEEPPSKRTRSAGEYTPQDQRRADAALADLRRMRATGQDATEHGVLRAWSLWYVYLISTQGIRNNVRSAQVRSDYSSYVTRLLEHVDVWQSLDDIPCTREASNACKSRITACFLSEGRDVNKHDVTNWNSGVMKGIDLFACKTTEELRTFVLHHPLP